MAKKATKLLTAPQSPPQSPPETFSQYTKRVAGLGEGAKIVLKAIIRNQGFTPEQIGETIGWSRMSVQSIIPNLFCSGLVSETGHFEKPCLWAVEVKAPPKRQPVEAPEPEEDAELELDLDPEVETVVEKPFDPKPMSETIARQVEEAQQEKEE